MAHRCRLAAQKGPPARVRQQRPGRRRPCPGALQGAAAAVAVPAEAARGGAPDPAGIGAGHGELAQ
eukprot:10865477-Lingulodinium_polyedra.AAC.1